METNLDSVTTLNYGFMMNLQRALEEQKQQTAPDIQQVPGLLGVPLNGQRRVEVSGRNGYVYVRLRANQNEVMQAYNNQVAPAYNLPVLLERQGNKYVVIGVDTARYENNWTSQSPFLPRHGNTHSFDLETGGGGDIVWVQSRQIVPALVFPSGSSGADSVIVNPYVLRNNAGEWKYIGNTGTVSFSPYRPTGSNALMLLVYLDSETGNPGFVVNSGSVFSNTLTGTSQIIQYIPALPNQVTQIPLAAIRLITGTNQISWDNIYDVRQWLHPMASGSAGGGLSSVAVQDEGTPQGNVTTFNFVGEVVSATVSGSVARIFVTGSASGGINTGTLDARYLKLDASNDPITGPLQILNPTGTNVAFTITQKDSEWQAFQIVHNPVPGREIQDDTGSIERIGPSGTIFPFPALKFADSETTNQSWVYGEIIQARKNAVTRTNIHPYATGTIINYVWDTDRTRPTGTIHTDFRVSGSSIAYIDVSGTVFSNNSPLIKEAPVDGQSYARKNAGWELAGSGDVGGWVSDSNTWSFISADSPSYNVSINANITGSIGVGMKAQLSHLGATKNFFVTSVSVTGSTSYVTLYGGTDFSLTTGAITTPKYSYEKAPFGFPLSPAKWTVETSDTTRRSYAPPAPTTETWYNLGSVNIVIPVGTWDVSYTLSAGATNNPPSSCFTQITLSTANNSESDADFTSYGQYNSVYQGFGPQGKNKTLALASKTTYYLNIRATGGSAADLVSMNDLHKLFIRARCAYL